MKDAAANTSPDATSNANIQFSVNTQPSASTRASAGIDLLQRPIPDVYRVEQAERLAQPLSQNEQSDRRSVLVFRLCEEWFALPADLCRQILRPLSAHTLPHRSNTTLLGVVNVRGQMLLKVSLLDVLGLCRKSPKAGAPISKTYPRMVVIEKVTAEEGSAVWVFEVDELDGIQSIDHSQLECPAAGVSAGDRSCTHRVFLWQEHRVNLLDAHQLFEALRLRVL